MSVCRVNVTSAGRPDVVAADQAAAQALARELAADFRKAVTVHRRGDRFLVVLDGQPFPPGWSAEYVVPSPEEASR